MEVLDLKNYKVMAMAQMAWVGKVRAGGRG